MPPANWQIRQPESASEWTRYFDLRWRILRKPWGQPRGSERDEFETSATHVMAVDAAAKVVGVGRLHILQTGEGQIRYMAVEPAYEGQGIATTILQKLEEAATQNGIVTLRLNARENARGFYQCQGYHELGDAPSAFGIPHIRMGKDI